VQVAYFLALGLVFGVEVQGGVPGVLVVMVIGVIAGTGFAALGVVLALRARNASTMQGIFPLVFVVLFVSSAFFPEDLLQAPADWIAPYNPLSFIADGMREPIIAGVKTAPVLEGLAIALGLTVIAVGLAVAALRGKLREA
jgi:ABC-2 type transport system permease protein